MNDNLEMYAFIFIAEDGKENVITAKINNKVQPLIAHCVADIEAMSSLAIDLAAQNNVKVKLAKYQKIQDIDFGYFLK
ncbi:hypothetical protein EK599_02685 [Vibrio sp. T187]|uniref:hypothetical protein n=1 Tax=Vibrio TaxID=662 RepID=UPI0010C9E432|nr:MULTISPECIES: hypothetical protein [Vibrio]MBW3694581.1 hypothetical protein [Vibrio sp. T187]